VAEDRRILQVSGSIALADTRRAMAWAIGRCLDAIARIDPRLIVHGGAVGGDSAASDAARIACVPELLFPKGPGMQTARLELGLWEPVGEVGDDLLPAYDGHPIHRDRVMIEWCKRRHTVGVRVWSLALYAPWCKRYAVGRGGTRYTHDRAKAAGFTCGQYVCPPEYGPGGDR
jgi:hypothetical protein